MAERHHEKGNALWLIIIAIFLLGGLTVMLTRSSGTSDETGDFEKTQIKVTELMRYANSLATAVQSLKFNGKCSENEISFDNSTVVGYTNGSAPTDDSCSVFKVKGGGQTWRSPPEGINDGSQWIITGANKVAGVGCDTAVAGCSELLLLLPGLTEAACLRVNSLMKTSNPSNAPPNDADSTIDTTLFQGAFSATETISDSGGALNGKETGCIDSDGSGANVFYSTLLKR